MPNLAQFALVTLTSVLFIVDPIAVIPTYLVITQRETPQQRAAFSLVKSIDTTFRAALRSRRTGRYSDLLN